MKIVMFGSRHWLNYARIRADVADLKAIYAPGLMIIHGDAPLGADALVDKACRELEVPCFRERARWHDHDRQGLTPVQCWCEPAKISCRGAGFRRNQRMLDRHRPDMGVGYRAAGKSRGTDDMIQRCRAANVPTKVILSPDSPPVIDMWADIRYRDDRPVA